MLALLADAAPIAAQAAEAALLSKESLIAFLTLAALEIVLGIDNIVVIAIVTSRLPIEQQARARNLGLGGAMFMRVGLLFAISWVMGLTATIFTAFGEAISGRDLILLIGGLFLMAKATHEIHQKMEVEPHGGGGAKIAASFGKAIATILALDLVFSLDSVITAVGMAKHIEIMIAAVVASVLVMMAFSGHISGFIERHPTIKVLALSFLLLIGVVLTAEAFEVHLDKKYIYFAMGFSLLVELVNLRVMKVHLPGAHPPVTPPAA
ncbi:MAG: TerC family protein [Candidatus Sumerlaeia bacterium]|nr:TerC family protein [Candidatus Sumerlaeia bacterium]